MLIHLRKPLSMYGSSCKSGSPILDSRITPPEILGFGQNHTADTMVLHLQRTSHYVAIFLPLTVSVCRHFLQQNDAIQNGTVNGENINLKVLGIGDGLTVGRLEILTGRRVANDPNKDPLSQYPSFTQYAQSNPYYPLVNSSAISAANTAWTQTGGCRDQVSHPFPN